MSRMGTKPSRALKKPALRENREDATVTTGSQFHTLAAGSDRCPSLLTHLLNNQKISKLRWCEWNRPSVLRTDTARERSAEGLPSTAESTEVKATIRTRLESLKAWLTPLPIILHLSSGPLLTATLSSRGHSTFSCQKPGLERPLMMTLTMPQRPNKESDLP